MSKLIEIILSEEKDFRNSSLDSFCKGATAEQLCEECKELDKFWRNSQNLYEKVRALFFLYAIHRFYLPWANDIPVGGKIPFEGYTNLLKRRFVEAIERFLEYQNQNGPSQGISSALATSYHKLGFQILADQVRKSVKSVRGNQWMFRIGHPEDHPLRINSKLLKKSNKNNLFPILQEKTPVRMDLTHSGWSDIFFLGMDFPEGARVLNISIDLAVKNGISAGKPKPPVEAYFRIIDKPVIKLTSVDLNATVELSTIDEAFDFAKDYLGLLKAAIIASGIVLPGMEGAQQPLSVLLGRLIKPGFGFELVSKVNDIPKGSRLAVSTNLLASLIAVCMRATNQTSSFTESLSEEDRRLIVARAILGEWLGGSGGGWQDSGGLWPGIKTISGVRAKEENPEYGISNGCLLPQHNILSEHEVSSDVRKKLHDSLVLVHGGMAQDVGPVLEMVTEKYLLRSENEWIGRKYAMRTFDQIVELLKEGNVREIGIATQSNFIGPIQTIIPWATNLYTETLINKVQEEFDGDFWGFWMLGGMSGGGMGFIFDPARKKEAQNRLQEIMSETKNDLKAAVPFAMEPVVYNFSINENGSYAQLLLDENALFPVTYYALVVPDILRSPLKLTTSQRNELAALGRAGKNNSDYSDIVQMLFDRILPSNNEENESAKSLKELLKLYGFDKEAHEQIRTDLKNGRIGLAQNRLPVSSTIEDVKLGDVFNTTNRLPEEYYNAGINALKKGEVAVVSLAAGSGSRWTKGAGVVKGLNPYKLRSGYSSTDSCCYQKNFFLYSNMISYLISQLEVKMKKEITKTQMSGWLILFANIILLLASIAIFIYGIVLLKEREGSGGYFLALGIILLLTSIFIFAGLFTVEPNEAVVLILFGKYIGTEKTTGFRWANPLYTKKKISLRVRNFDSEKLKVNDEKGNPIEISAVVVWKVEDTAEAVFEVDDYLNYVHVQSESAIRHLATSYPYDDTEGEKISLRSSLDEVSEHLKKEIDERVNAAGVVVLEARINHLAYSPEIAHAMLQRQQAQAIIAARQKIVEGAVGMVEMALDKLKEKSIVDLDEERKATMVSNLMVVLCSDKAAQPIINAGSLY